MNNTIAEEFEKRQNIKANAFTTFNTSTGWVREKPEFKAAKQCMDAWSTLKIELPAKFLNVSDELDSVLRDSDLLKELNELVLRDKQEAYVRELLNRIDRCCRYLKEKDSCEFNAEIPIAILKNDIPVIKERYDRILDTRKWIRDHRIEGEDVLAEILGVKGEKDETN